MLEPETLKPYLLDDDPWVRNAVARYFDEGWFQDEELVPLILDAWNRFGYPVPVVKIQISRASGCANAGRPPAEDLKGQTGMKLSSSG